MTSITIRHKLRVGLAAAALAAVALVAAGCEDPSIRLNQDGMVYYAAGDYTKARAAFEEAIHRNPDVGAYYFNRGMCEQVLGHFDEAIMNYQLATRIAPSIEAAFESEAQCYIEKGMPDKAQESLIAGTRANPYTGEAFINVGRFCLSRDDIPGAKLWMAKAVAADPDNPAAHREYALLLARTGDRDKAIQELRKSLDLDPVQPDVSARLTELAPSGSQLPPAKPQTK